MLKKRQGLVILLFLLIFIFSEFIFDKFSDITNSTILRQTGHYIDYFLGAYFYLAFLFLLICSPILMSLPKFKNYRKFLVLNFSTVILFIIFFTLIFNFSLINNTFLIVFYSELQVKSFII